MTPQQVPNILHFRLSYMLRLPADWTPEKQAAEGCDPILYLHGLGFGLASVRRFRGPG